MPLSSNIFFAPSFGCISACSKMLKSMFLSSIISSALALLHAIMLKTFREYASFSDNSAFAVHCAVGVPGDASSVVALCDAYCQMYP